MNTQLNDNTIQLLKEKKAYYDEMSSICADILQGSSIADVCKNHNSISVSNFRHRIFRKEEPYSKIMYTPEQLLEMTKNLMTPEETIFRDILKIYDKSHFHMDFPEDFEDTIHTIIDEILDDRTKEIIRLKYFENKTCEEIGQLFKVSRSRIQQIIERFLSQMRRSDRIERIVYGDKQFTQKYLGNSKKLADFTEKSIDLQTRIEDLELNARITHCLIRAKKYTLEDVLNTPEEELLKIKHFGMKCLVELRQSLNQKGYM